jgi:hypothetical protein
MASSLSPKVVTREIDLTTTIRAASETIAGYANQFVWGPIGKIVTVQDEVELGLRMGTPKAVFSATALDSNLMATSFLTGASYLAYSNALKVSRVANINDPVSANNAKNSVADLATSGIPSALLVKNIDDFQEKESLGALASYFLLGKYAGVMGNSIKFSACFTSNQYKSPVILNASGDWVLNKNDAGKKTLEASLIDTTIHFTVGDFVTFTYEGVKYRNKIESQTATKLTLSDIGSNLPYFPSSATTGIVLDIRKEWEFANAVNGAPSLNEFHLVLSDSTGYISGEVGTVLEVYSYLSVDIGKTNADGTTAYWRNVLNDQSEYVWAGTLDLTSALASNTNKTTAKMLVSGSNGTTPTQDDYIQASELFLDKSNVNISVFIAPPVLGNLDDSTVANYLIQNLAEVRKDVVIYLSPKHTDVVNKPNLELDNVLSYRNTLPSTSYAFMDCNWKYMIDKYNNTFRWIPLCGDVAGTAARTDDELEAWYSHAGYNRGLIKNCIKLAWNPRESQRDELYPQGVNPVIFENNIGHLLLGDRTLLARPSAFDRINVRRLFIVLEKLISDAAKFQLFEFNDDITRSRFVSIVEPFMRDVKARRGVDSYYVQCDERNNTAQVINTNRFVGSIYVVPKFSINFIQLNFISVPNGISFETVVGTI